MRLFFAIAYLLILGAYVVSHAYDVTGRALEVRDYAESLALYIFLLSLAFLSVSEIAARWLKSEGKTASEIMAENMRAHIYTTRIIVFIVIIGFPLFAYFNWSRGWGISDAVIVAIPTILLAIVIAEQNLYNYLSSRLERTGIEQARVAAVFQIVDTIYKDPSRSGVPEQHDVDELEHRLRIWEDRTAEPNFAKFAAQARSTLFSIKRNSADSVWEQYLERLHSDLSSYVQSYT